MGAHEDRAIEPNGGWRVPLSASSSRVAQADNGASLADIFERVHFAPQSNRRLPVLGSEGGCMSDTITPIQSARLNMTMAIKDLQFALDSFDREELAWASLCIGNAIEHLTAAKAKIETEMKGGTP
jgi:hypothetical protein